MNYQYRRGLGGPCGKLPHPESCSGRAKGRKAGVSPDTVETRTGNRRALPSRPMRGATGPHGPVASRARATVFLWTPISAAMARSDFSGLVAMAARTQLETGIQLARPTLARRGPCRAQVSKVAHLPGALSGGQVSHVGHLKGDKRIHNSSFPPPIRVVSSHFAKPWGRNGPFSAGNAAFAASGTVPRVGRKWHGSAPDRLPTAPHCANPHTRRVICHRVNSLAGRAPWRARRPCCRLRGRRGTRRTRFSG
jgi:hypothetical protein